MTVWQKRDARMAPWLLAPALGLIAVFVLWPVVRALIWSFTNTDLMQTGGEHFVGLSNYSDLLRDSRYRQAFANTGLFAILVVPIQTTLAFALALWVNARWPAWRWLRTVFFIPVVVAAPVLAILWTLLYQPAQGNEIGLVNAFAQVLGIPPQAWLRDPSLALPAIAFMCVWQGVGLQMMVFLSGLQGVPSELVEAARIDGASRWQQVRHVIIPSLRNTIVFVVTVTTILAFRIFVQPYLMTRGGPGDRTLSLVQSIYEMAFVSQDLGRACAAMFLFLAWVGLLTLLLRYFSREERA